MKFLVKELVSTKYLYCTINVDLINCFNNILEVTKDHNAPCKVANKNIVPILDAIRNGNSVEFDLADCFITPDCAQIIQNYASEGLVFIDTANYWRNKILKDNRSRESISNIELTELPPYTYDSITLEYVKALDPEKNYCLPSVDDGGIYLRLAYIITVVRPEVKIILGSNDKKFMTFIGKRLNYNSLIKYKEFYFVSNEGVKTVDFNYPVYSSRLNREVNIEDALTIGYLVPMVLGTKVVLNEPCFRRIFEDCLNVLESYRYTKKKKLKDVIGVKNYD